MAAPVCGRISARRSRLVVPAWPNGMPAVMAIGSPTTAKPSRAAARQAASGDTMALSQMLSRVLSSPQGAELVQRLENRLQQ